MSSTPSIDMALIKMIHSDTYVRKALIDEIEGSQDDRSDEHTSRNSAQSSSDTSDSAQSMLVARKEFSREPTQSI